ncbi:MAG TPA: PP2C family protein-serine/threonine phosphatase [Anaerolineales bacterium]|nr:PP2C family protein-serine/threonine phosphatase [Anaerolineales bacterium]
MEVSVGVAKVRKYATSESGDTVEVIERPNGGLSIVMADGQSSGRGAKWISTLVVRKVITLLSEGVRDGAAARAASDTLFTERGGRVSSTLNILSVDNQTRTLVITRNNPAALLIAKDEEIKVLAEPCLPIGLYRGTRPLISEVDLEPGLTAVVFSDGLVHAGDRYGQSMDVPTSLQALLDGEDPSAQMIADSLLEHALRLDRGRPSDDVSVVVLRVKSYTGDEVRRMTVRLPLVP